MRRPVAGSDDGFIHIRIDSFVTLRDVVLSTVTVPVVVTSAWPSGPIAYAGEVATASLRHVEPSSVLPSNM